MEGTKQGCEARPSGRKGQGAQLGTAAAVPEGGGVELGWERSRGREMGGSRIFWEAGQKGLPKVSREVMNAEESRIPRGFST